LIFIGLAAGLSTGLRAIDRAVGAGLSKRS